MFQRSKPALEQSLRDSLHHAARAPFYARTWPASWRRIQSLQDLSKLPVLDKPAASQFQEELVVPGVRPNPSYAEAGIVSSATTRTGRPLRMLRSPDEHFGDAHAPPWKDDGTRTLVIYSARHGVRGEEGPERILLPESQHPNTVDVLVDLMDPRRRPRVRYLVAPVSSLKWVTVALQERGISPDTFGLLAIGTNGYPLTAHARRWLGAAWGAPLMDNFSLSELPGHASECLECGFLHWDGAPIWFECLDPITRKPASRLGELVATTFVPGVMRMPLIRYATGDIVEKGPLCRASGTHGMRFLGRTSQSLFGLVKGKTAYAALGRDLLEFAEDSPDISQEPHPVERMGRVPASDIGVPRAVLDAKQWRVQVELRFDPARHPERAASIAVELASRVFRRAPGLKRPTIQLLRPGSLDLARAALKL